MEKQRRKTTGKKNNEKKTSSKPKKSPKLQAPEEWSGMTNFIEVTGYLKNKSALKFDTDKNNKEVISGNLTIQYGEEPEDQLTLNVYSSKTTSGGNESKGYLKLKDIIEKGIEYTGEELEGDALPTTIKVVSSRKFNATVGLNEYAKEGEFVSAVRCTLGYGNFSVNSVDVDGEDMFPDGFGAKFTMDVIVEKISDYTDEEEGCFVLEAYHVNYNNEIEPHTFVIENENFGNGMYANVNEGDTVRVWGTPSIASVVTKVENESAWGGESSESTEYERMAKLLVTGGRPTPVKYPHLEKDGIIEEMLKARAVKKQNMIDGVDQKTPSQKRNSRQKVDFANTGFEDFQDIDDDDVPF